MMNTTEHEHRPMAASQGHATFGGIPVTLLAQEDALDLIVSHAQKNAGAPLGVVSVNLDHVHHFGLKGRWAGTLHADPASVVDWLYLIDGAPVVTQAHRVTGLEWPRLAGSDLSMPLLHFAEEYGISVAFLGGSPDNQSLLRHKLTEDFPKLLISGMWSPDRTDLESRQASQGIAAEIAVSGARILFVGLGKPRQELWMNDYGALTGAAVLLGFGAVVDFLAGRVRRAPKMIAEHGLEWVWRLVLEPRRLANRYLVNGPAAYLKLRTASAADKPVLAPGRESVEPATLTPGRFTLQGPHVDVEVVVVTYNSGSHIDDMLMSLRAETTDLTLRVHLADNASTDGTLELVRETHPDVLTFATGGNLGYAAGINAALRRAGSSEVVVILNPDLTVAKGSLAAMLKRMRQSQAGVVVPKLLDQQGRTSPSIFREPSIATAFGDALFGGRMPGRPAWLAGMDYASEFYAYPRTVTAATGAALMIRRAVADYVPWDESYFLYSEETAFFRTVGAIGEAVWYEPHARMTHIGGGSASSPELNALLSVNRVRYVRNYHSKAYSRVFRAVVAADALLRSGREKNKGVF